MAQPLLLGTSPVTIRDIVDVADRERAVAFDPSAESAIAASAEALGKLTQAGERIYGVTTGLGAAVDNALK